MQVLNLSTSSGLDSKIIMLNEAVQRKSDVVYLSLSPIYDSIFKEGYAAACSHQDLLNAQQAVIIDSKAMALGGISSEHLLEIRILGFGGAVLLGGFCGYGLPTNRSHCVHRFHSKLLVSAVKTNSFIR